MTRPHSNVDAEQASAPLLERARAVALAPRVVDAFYTLFSVRIVECTLGWPRLLSSAASARAWLRDGDIMIELSRSAAVNGAFELGISLRPDGAVQLVDALLGGRVDSALASTAGQPSEAECGVLAYAVARLVRESGEPWVLRDVRPCARGELDAGFIACPIALAHVQGTLQATLWLRELGSWTQRVDVMVTEPAPGLSVAPGDEWISEGNLTLTSEGLVGSVQLATAGTRERLTADLRRESVHVRGSAPETAGVDLVLGSAELHIMDVCALAAGRVTAIDCSGDQAELRAGGRSVARGELIQFRGAIGIRVRELS